MLFPIVFSTAVFSIILHLVSGDCECSCKTSCNNHINSLLLSHASVPSSCANIKSIWPDSASGYYTIVNNQGQSMTVYCQMEPLCDIDGPWTRVAYLDMTVPTQSCPSNLREYGANGVRVCGRPVSNKGSCAPVYFDVPADPYSKVCGRVSGYQFATTSSVLGHQHSSIDVPYVDGVSLTKGSPRQHVWTFMTGLLDRNSPPQYACPCAASTIQRNPSFIEGHYFCEAGNPGPDHSTTLHTADPLWDGQSCGAGEEACCRAPGIPWFKRDFDTPSNDYLELRVCSDQDTVDEDAPVGFYEIYVK